MRRALLYWPFLVLLATSGAYADARMSVLVDVLKLQDAVMILRDEGLTYAEDLNQEMLNGQGGAGWQVQMDKIYDPARMVETVRTELANELEGTELEQTISFFSSDLGQRIITLENTARAAIQDPSVEEAARGKYGVMQGTDDPRLGQITSIIEAGDMISWNVTGAMNSNLQFLRGLVDGQAFEMSEEEMLDDAASDLEASRQDTTGWLYGFLLMAYHPLSTDEMQSYITYSSTPAGQALNRALFTGFGKAYEDISYALGRAVALNMTAQDL